MLSYTGAFIIHTQKMFRTYFDAQRKQWNGLKSRPLFNPQTTLGEVLLKSMQMHGPKIAQVRF